MKSYGKREKIEKRGVFREFEEKRKKNKVALKCGTYRAEGVVAGYKDSRVAPQNSWPRCRVDLRRIT